MSYPPLDPRGASWGEAAVPEQFQMTPLTTGQILDRAFALYRSNFSLFAGLAVFPAAVALLFGLGQIGFLLATHSPLNWFEQQPFTAVYFATLGIVLLGVGLKLCVYGVSISATTWCIARIYLNEQATMKLGFDFALRRWGRYLMLVVAQFWFACWLPFAVLFAAVIITSLVAASSVFPPAAVGIVLFLEVGALLVWVIYNSLRVALAIPVSVVEDMRIMDSIKRSRSLLRTRKVRVFLLFLFLAVLNSVFLAVLLPLAILVPKMGPHGLLIYQLATLAVSFIYGVLISPIAAVGLCLIYFDERVRREGFDIEFMMARSTPPPPMPEALSAE